VIEEVISKALLDQEKISWVTIGISGCDTQKDYDQLFKSFSTGNMVYLKDKLTVVNDTKIGLYCGTTPPGIVVVAGTGCNVYGVNAHGEEASAGNWGHFLGDKGSGFQLAKRMFQAVVEAYDGTGDPTILNQKIEKRLGFTSVADIADWGNDAKPSIHEVSDFAPLVIEAAEEGDTVAKDLIDKTVGELGKAISAVVKRLKLENEYNRVVIIGGLFESKYFRAVFEGYVTALLKRCRIVKPLVSAAVGAAIMAKGEWEKTGKLPNVK
jgi:N-acetylglucosamine kinase-like BadF-type ATPase